MARDLLTGRLFTCPGCQRRTLRFCHGLCKPCYDASPEARAYQRAYRKSHIIEFREYQIRYILRQVKREEQADEG